ncbi:TPA: MFS transporter, partial [Streptococcus pneumoniae]
DLFHSWVPSVAALLLIDILMTVALFTVDRADKIL